MGYKKGRPIVPNNAQVRINYLSEKDKTDVTYDVLVTVGGVTVELNPTDKQRLTYLLIALEDCGIPEHFEVLEQYIY